MAPGLLAKWVALSSRAVFARELRSRNQMDLTCCDDCAGACLLNRSLAGARRSMVLFQARTRPNAGLSDDAAREGAAWHSSRRPGRGAPSPQQRATPLRSPRLRRPAPRRQAWRPHHLGCLFQRRAADRACDALPSFLGLGSTFHQRQLRQLEVSCREAHPHPGSLPGYRPGPLVHPWVRVLAASPTSQEHHPHRIDRKV